MSSNSYLNSSYDADVYQSHRPTYPDSFYSKILNYHKKHSSDLDTLLDVGCGTGVTTIPFAKYFNKSIGVDFSPNMIITAKEATSKLADSEKFRFEIAKAEDSDSIVEQESVDVLTAAECVHYTDNNRFIETSLKVLKKSGTLAYWIYIRPIFENERINDVFNEFTFSKDGLLSDFQLFLKQVNEKILIDPRFSDVEVSIFNQYNTKVAKDYNPESLPGNSLKVYSNYEQHKDDILDVYKTFTIDGFAEFFTTFRSTQEWYAANPELKGTDKDIANVLKNALVDAGWNPEEKITVVWDTMYLFATKA